MTGSAFDLGIWISIIGIIIIMWRALSKNVKTKADKEKVETLEKDMKAEIKAVEKDMKAEIKAVEERNTESHRLMQESNTAILKGINSKLIFIENWIIKKTK